MIVNHRFKALNDLGDNGHYEPKRANMITQYRSLIIPEDFNIKTVDTYGCILPIELMALQHHILIYDQLRQIIVDALKLCFLFEPIILALKKSNSKINQFTIKDILRVIIRGQFYQFINNVENPLKILVNNRTTEANIKILTSALLLISLNKMNLKDIEMIMLIFTLEASLYDQERLTIPLDTFIILKVLKKINRVIRPFDFKFWQENFKKSTDFHGEFQAHHFLFLCSICQRKNTGHNIFKFNLNGVVKGTNNNGKVLQLQEKQNLNNFKQQKQRKIVRGLLFVEGNRRYTSCTKELLKQMRIRNPSRGKRPNTALLRRNMSEYLQQSLKSHKNGRKTVSQSQNLFLLRKQQPTDNSVHQKLSKFQQKGSTKPYHLKLTIKKANKKQLVNKIISFGQKN